MCMLLYSVQCTCILRKGKMRPYNVHHTVHPRGDEYILYHGTRTSSEELYLIQYILRNLEILNLETCIIRGVGS